jgi:hypothetical protein
VLSFKAAIFHLFKQTAPDIKSHEKITHINSSQHILSNSKIHPNRSHSHLAHLYLTEQKGSYIGVSDEVLLALL